MLVRARPHCTLTVFASTLLVGSACAPSQEPADARAAPATADRSAPPTTDQMAVSALPVDRDAAPEPTVAAAPARCPRVPLRLEVEAPGRKPVPMLTLDAAGRVDVSSMGGPALRAELDPRGCLVGPDGLWVELTPARALWTAHELLETDGAAIRLADGAALQIRPDGTVIRVERDGGVQSNAYGTIRLRGYRDEADCAGLILLAAFLAMMPSMAVVDGHPAMAPVPADSLCNGFRASTPQPLVDGGAR